MTTTTAIHKWNNEKQAVKMLMENVEDLEIKAIYQMEKTPARQRQNEPEEMEAEAAEEIDVCIVH